MMTLVLCVLFVVPVALLPMALARRAAGHTQRQRAVAVAAVGARHLAEVESYTQDCAHAACLLIEHAPEANPTFVRGFVQDALQQIDTVQRAERLRGALGLAWRPRSTIARAFSDVLLEALLVLDARVVARVVALAGPAGVVWLRRMTDTALARFRVAATDAGEARFVSLFAEDLAALDMDSTLELRVPPAARRAR